MRGVQFLTLWPTSSEDDTTKDDDTEVSKVPEKTNRKTQKVTIVPPEEEIPLPPKFFFKPPPLIQTSVEKDVLQSIVDALKEAHDDMENLKSLTKDEKTELRLLVKQIQQKISKRNVVKQPRLSPMKRFRSRFGRKSVKDEY